MRPCSASPSSRASIPVSSPKARCGIRSVASCLIAETGVIGIGEPIGAIAVAESGALLVAGARRLHVVDHDGAIRSGRPLIDGEGRRLNDGKPDPSGRFVVGTAGAGGSELLLRAEDDGSTSVIDDDLALSNGLAWSVDGRRLCHVDTVMRRVFIRDYDPLTGGTGARETLVRLEEGAPDGMTVDADDHLWVAAWGSGCVLRISPSGEIVGRIDVPAPHVSSVAFAGPDLDTLVITTARESLPPEQLAASPDSGRLFTARVGVAGGPARLWSGSFPRRR
jgi:sugar lactone lactonase YvrE